MKTRAWRGGLCGSLLVVALAGPRFARPASTSAAATVVLAGGCFWGVEAVFEHVRGVKYVVSGYATPAFGANETVPATHLGVAEAIKVTYDPTELTFAQILQIFFLVAHDPTELDRQGPDVGTRYRSIVFVSTDEERRLTHTTLDSLRTRHAYAAPIVTEVATLRRFIIAEPFHQDFVARNPRSAYVVINDLPKLEHLRQRFPAHYRQ